MGMTSDDMERSIPLEEELITYISQGGMPVQAGPQRKHQVLVRKQK